MATKRYVRENADGGWDVLKEGDRRPRTQASSKTEAVARARSMVRREGGGEIRVVNRAGKIVGSSRVARTSRSTNNGRN